MAFVSDHRLKVPNSKRTFDFRPSTLLQLLQGEVSLMKNPFASTKMLLTTTGLLALMLALLVAPGGALAHAKLTSSTPADGSTVAPGLTTITMVFGEEV